MTSPSLKSLALTLAVVLAGCAAKAAPVPTQSLTGLSASVGRGDARADAIVMVAKEATPEITRAQIIELAGKIKADFIAMAAQIEQSRRDEKLMDGTINSQAVTIGVRDARIAELDTWWFGPRFWRAIGWVIAAGVGLIAVWFGLGMLSIYAPILWGIKGIGISKLIIRALPFANVFSNARDHKIANALGLVPGYVPAAAPGAQVGT